MLCACASVYLMGYVAIRVMHALRPQKQKSLLTSVIETFL